MTSVHFPPGPDRRLAGRLALTLLLAAGPSFAAPAREALPPDLALVPRDAAGFVHVRAADLWHSETMADMRQLISRAGPATYQDFVRKIGPDPSIIDRVTFVLLAPQTLGEPFPTVDPEAMSALIIVRTSKPFDRLQVRKLLGQREKIYRRHVYHFNEDLWSGLALIDNQTFVIGSEDALVQFFDRMPNPNSDGPLQDALMAAADKHILTLGLNPQLLGKEGGAQALPPPLPKLLEARCATFTFDLAKESRLALRLSYAKDDEAQAGEKALRGALDLARAALAPGIQQLEAQLKQKSENGPAAEVAQGFALLIGLGILREIDTQLKDAPVQRQGTAVSLVVTSKRADISSLTVVSLAAITAIGKSVSRTFQTVGSALGGGQDPTEEHLKKLAEALDKYQKDKGTYPAPATYDPDGRPLLSWRVMLLPYLDQEALYKEFRLDEPWDSLHNKKLLKKLPAVFKAPNKYSRNKTSDLVFTGESAAFIAKKGIAKADIAGSAILLVDATSDSAVYWSKPADLAYTDDQPLPAIFGKYGYEQIKVLLANGTCRTLDRQTNEQALRALIRRTAAKKDK